VGRAGAGGAGAPRAGVAWDAALRGFDVVLVDRADLAEARTRLLVESVTEPDRRSRSAPELSPDHVRAEASRRGLGIVRTPVRDDDDHYRHVRYRLRHLPEHGGDVVGFVEGRHHNRARSRHRLPTVVFQPA
jgi:hypothetical protein